MKKLNILAAIAILAAAVSACSVKENPVNEPVPAPESKVVTLVATLEPTSGPETRSTMTDNGTTISASWEVGDKVWVNYDDTGENNVVAKGTVTAVDGEGKATITVDLVNPKNSSIIVFGYPYDHWTEAKDVRIDQVGTLADINQNHAAVFGSGTLTVVGSEVTLPTSVPMNAELAIWKLNFKDGGTDITNQITSLNISFGPSDDYMVTPNAQSDIYVALYPVDGGNITITAATASGNYSYSNSGVTLDKGKFYRSEVAMSASAASDTYRVFTTRTAYSDVEIPGGATNVENSATAVTWTAGTYVVNNEVTIDGGVTLAGNVNLILCDGAELTITDGHIECPKDEGNTWDYLYSMNIYGQTLGTGKLTIVDNDINLQAHDLGIHGGIITITDGGVMQGIESDGILSIYHGTIIASCGANGIISMGTANIYGGNITATSTGGYGAAILAASGNLAISGGTITATNTGTSAGIEASGNLTITGGTVTARGGTNMEGINVYGTCTISGGNVTAIAGENGIGLEGTITISGGDVIAIGGNAHADSDSDGGAGIDGSLTVTGGVVTATGGAKDGTGDDGLGISGGSTIALTGVTMYEDAGSTPEAIPAKRAGSQTACTKRYVIIQ